MYWIIGIIVYVIIISLFFLFNYGAHINDPDDLEEDIKALANRKKSC